MFYLAVMENIKHAEICIVAATEFLYTTRITEELPWQQSFRLVPQNYSSKNFW